MASHKSKHTSTGLTPEPVSRRLKLEADKQETDDPQAKTDERMHTEQEDLIHRLEDLQQQASIAKTQAAFLLAQHADSQREKARKELIFGGWSTFTVTATTPEGQGAQQEVQAESRERFIKEIAKKAGVTSLYYKDWIFSHQTRGDVLSPISVLTITQPWQRAKVLDYIKKANKNFPEKFYIDDKEETNWDKITQAFGQCHDKNAKDTKVQPQISLWDRITGIPLKVAMQILTVYEVPFKQNWRDLTLVDKHTNEYILWAHFSPDQGTLTVYISEANVPSAQQFCNDFLSNFDEYLNGSKGKGKGKGKTTQASGSNMDKDLGFLPLSHTSHARSAKYPFKIDPRVVHDKTSHWEVWKDLWQEALTTAHLPFSAARTSDAKE
eukprot:symbB.v1.2.010290.t1/scaffold666.1/size175110/2